MIKSITNRALTALFTVGLAAITPILEGCPKQVEPTTVPTHAVDKTLCQEPDIPENYSRHLRDDEYVIPTAVFAARNELLPKIYDSNGTSFLATLVTGDYVLGTQTHKLPGYLNGCDYSHRDMMEYAHTLSTKGNIILSASALQLPEQEFVDLLRYQRLLNELEELDMDASIPLMDSFQELASNYANREDSPFENDPNPTKYDLIRFVSSQQYAAEKDLTDDKGNSLSFSNIVSGDINYFTNLNYPGNTEALEALSQCLDKIGHTHQDLPIE
jgi:hypothetical protein